jgi:hypothetical protein
MTVRVLGCCKGLNLEVLQVIKIAFLGRMLCLLIGINCRKRKFYGFISSTSGACGVLALHPTSTIKQSKVLFFHI